MLRCLGGACCLLLAACATPSNWSERNAETGTVVVAFAADRSASPFRAFDLSLRRVDRAYETDIPFTVYGMDADVADFRSDREAGVVVQRRLAPGEYELTNLVGDRGTFWWSKEVRSQHPTAIRFQVLPGSTTYLGHFRVGLDASSATLALEISDESVLDVARARAKFPGLGAVQIAVAGAESGRESANSGALATP